MPNNNINKIIYGGQTLIDLTSDTVTADKILEGYTAHDKSGAIITGTNTYDSDTSDDTAAVAEILATKTAHARGIQLTGTMPNIGSVTGTISAVTDEYTIPQGYHDGSGKVRISLSEQAKIIAANIRSGVEILGITGTMSGDENVRAQSKTVTPTLSQQSITPDASYNYLSEVIVTGISYVETDNAAGGKTAIIAGIDN